MDEYEKLIESNEVYAEYIRQFNLTDKGIKEMHENANIFMIKILNSPILYRKLREKVYNHLKNLNIALRGEES